jgi:aryl-alcohol dehydrogenase-like predicted oxidoreductase
MQVRQLGKSGLKVSALALGTMTFGASDTYMKGITAEDTEARRIFDYALDAGITLIDTANSYSQGRTESLLGEWLSGGKRQRVVLATKCGLPVPEASQPGPNRDRGLSRAHIIESCEASLKRLKSDHVDLFQLHIQDVAVPIDETMRACDDLVRSGKVRYLGCSNFTGNRIVEALWSADRNHLHSFISVQCQWSLSVRGVEREIIPVARRHGLGVLVWSPLARGFLSGKYTRGAPAPTGSRLATWSTSFDRLDNGVTWDIVDTLNAIAGKHETEPSAIAIAWLLAQDASTIVNVGARTLPQLESNLKGAEIKLTEAEMAELSRVSQPDLDYPYDFISERGPL